MDRQDFMDFIRSDDLHEELKYCDLIETCLACLGFSDDLTKAVENCIEEHENPKLKGRLMGNGTSVVMVVRHIMTINNWEYYVTSQFEGNVNLCVVMGFETEMGDVDLEEIRPYIIQDTTELHELMPCDGWKWLS